MGEYGRDSLDLDDDDRLPWLEPADEDEGGDGLSTLKLLLIVAGGLALIALAVLGIWYVKDQNARSGGGDGTLIQAPPGDYKVAAKDADAKAFQGEGDTTYPVSEGQDRGGRIDPTRLPEVPVTGGGASPADSKGAKGANKPSQRVTAPVGPATPAETGKANGTGPASAGGPMIQLGAYGSEAVAKDAWSRLSKRFAYLAPLGTSIEKATVGNATYYRLRAIAPSATEASQLCGRLKVAGESCLVVR
jgi:hypothetical protein